MGCECCERTNGQPAGAGLAVGLYPPNYLSGGITANNAADPTNDLDFSACHCRDETNDTINLDAIAMTKRGDAAWSPGTGGGMLDAGVALAADSTYHLFMISGANGVADFLASLSLAPAMPPGYTHRRRIASRTTDDAGAWVATAQRGDYFTHLDGNYEVYNNLAPPVVWTLLTLDYTAGTNLHTIPDGIVVCPIIHHQIEKDNVTAGRYVSIFHGGYPNPARNFYTGAVKVAVERLMVGPAVFVQSNTQRQVKFIASHNTGWQDFRLIVLGWVDCRGKDGQ